MTLFLIEREFAEQLEMSPEVIEDLTAYNDAHELRWLFSFLSSDKKQTYCIYEAPDPASLRRQAADLGIPADKIVEINELNPAMFDAGSVTGHLAT